MRKVVLSALCAAALLTACNNSGQNKSTLQAQNDSLMLELSNRDTELDEIMEPSMKFKKDSAKSTKLKTV